MTDSKPTPEEIQTLFRQHPKLARTAMKTAHQEWDHSSVGMDITQGAYMVTIVWLAHAYLVQMLTTGETSIKRRQVIRHYNPDTRSKSRHIPKPLDVDLVFKQRHGITQNHEQN